ncbi:MAG: glycoside hydrolase family 2 protein [Lewinella sp.]|jgi:beta-galactosidase|uniref:glycoside hydrolase family 2 protein n=1 Tax=Lewinella sp. TaxID=2004506 RepID=UPI003D6AF382
MKNKVSLFLGLVGLFYILSSSNIGAFLQPLQERIRENINADWQYLPDNTQDVDQLKDKTNWQAIDLPHTWNQWDALDFEPGYRRDAGWYQKEIFLSDYDQAEYLLYFEGANISTEVYVNGALAGTHVGGYVGFEVNITPYVRRAQKNTISIRVDNSYNPNVIPSQKADFFIFGGITRDLWLEIVPQIRLQDIKVSTPSVSLAKAETILEVSLPEGVMLTKDYEVSAKIIASDKQVVAEKTFAGTSLNDKQALVMPVVDQPQLWSPDHPNLYQVAVQLLRNGRVLDEKTTTIGYRWYHFEQHGAFYLNGERLLLRGTHRHEEHAGYGAAMPNEQHRKDIAQIKEMGANFIRLGHYPQDPEIYRACNELGLIVWDELPWCRGGMGESEWQANTERLLLEQIQQNYNHPSIMFWALGNEIYWLPDFENGDDEERLNAYVTKLNNLAHKADPYRLTSLRKYYAGADLVDVFSPSIWSGWYAGVYTNYKNTLTQNQKKYAQFLHMEYGGSSHVGRHTENPITGEGALSDDDWAEVANQVNVENVAKKGDWTENYIVDLFDYYLSVTETQPNFAGNAQWAFKDFGTPLRPQNAIPYLNQKGLVDRDGNPKDAYYVYKSYWGKTPFVYIESHTWTYRRGPEGKARNISVYSNCETVELIHNGQKLGRKNRVLGQLPAGGLNWDVSFTAGENTLIAVGFAPDGSSTSDTLTITYDFQQAGKADNIQLSKKTLPNGNFLVEAVMLDKSGVRVLDYEEEIYFTCDGAGTLLRHYGTPTRSQVLQMANGRAAIELTPEESGRAIIEARNQDFKGSYLVIDFTKENAAKTKDNETE